MTPKVSSEIRMHDELEKIARKCGIAAAGFRNSSGVVTLNLWSEGLARRDIIGISMFNGGVGCCVPHNGTQGFFGTAPMVYPGRPGAYKKGSCYEQR